jgi:hypothetical protein
MIDSKRQKIKNFRNLRGTEQVGGTIKASFTQNHASMKILAKNLFTVSLHKFLERDGGHKSPGHEFED